MMIILITGVTAGFGTKMADNVINVNHAIITFLSKSPSIIKAMKPA